MEAAMLTAEGCQQRRQRLWQNLSEKPDFLLISTPQHLVYLANYFPSQYVFRTTNSQAVLILGADGASVLVADSMVKTYADEAHVDEIVAPAWYDGRHTAPIRGELLLQSVLERLATVKGTHVGVESTGVAAGIADRLAQQRGTLRLTAIDQTLHQMKRSKDPDEIELIRLAMRAGDAGHAAGLEQIRPGLTEVEACLLVHRAAETVVGEPALVYGDFVSGPRTGRKGGPPSQRVIEAGDLVLLDFSVVVRGYRGDFANTFVCGARPTDEQRRLHDACLAAIDAGQQLFRPGTAARDIDRAVRNSFDTQHLAANFTSHSGHGIGLGHPDPPFLVAESDDTLVLGDVVALEPGLYYPDEFGMRFEHNYLITADGHERLSNHRLQIAQPDYV